MRSSTGQGEDSRLPPEDILRVRAKAEIRKRLRALRKTTPLAACAARSGRIVANLLGLALVAGARDVALFWPIEEKHEVDLRPLDVELRAQGKRVYYPTILSSGEMVFGRVDDPARMIDHPLGFRAPDEGEPRAEDLDVIVVPALAIDASGHRIGYGAGYYDRALATTRRAVTVGVAYDFQLVPEVPASRDDVPVAWVVTDRRVFRAGAPVPAAAPEPPGHGRA